MYRANPDNVNFGEPVGRRIKGNYMTSFFQRIKSELQEARLLSPVIVASHRCLELSDQVSQLVPEAEVARGPSLNLMGRDVVLIHSGEMGWEEALELVCQQSPGRLYVISPELPRSEALKLEWVADRVVVGEETFQYEVHELGLSA